MKYILSKTAIKAINYTPGIKARISLILEVSEATINRLLRENDQNPNNDLTKYAVLLLIESETSVPVIQLLKAFSATKQNTAA